MSERPGAPAPGALPHRVLVKGFGKAGCGTAPGPGASVAGLLPASFARKLWRFCSNPRVAEAAVIEPWHAAIRREAAAAPGVLLAVHDRSTLSFGGHPSEADRATPTQARDPGYDLATALMARGGDGAPIAPASVALTAARAVHSTRDDPPPAGTCHVDQVLPAMPYVRGLGLGPAAAHVIDREADSVDHRRRWAADGHTALVRADDRKALHRGQATSRAAVADGLRRDGGSAGAGAAMDRGRKARPFVAEAAVVLHRPGERNAGARRVEVPGPPLPPRLVVAEVRDPGGRVLARRLLLTDAPADSGDAAAVARWYHFRWRIEGLHELLKAAGRQPEGWLRRDGGRVLKRLLIAPGACASTWALERRHDAESEGFEAPLMRMSGRQTERGVPVTTAGMPAGLWVLQAALGPLARHGPDGLNTMLEAHLPPFAAKT